MKVRIKNYYGDEPSDLSLEKVYLAEQSEKWFGTYDIADDSGYKISIKLNGCDHLNGGEWEIIEE